MACKNLEQAITHLSSPLKNREFVKLHAAEIREVRSFKRYNREHFCIDFTGIPWSIIESFDDINDAVSAWNSLFIDVANRHAPLKRIRTKGGLKPWLTNDIKELMAKRDHALKMRKSLDKTGAIIGT